MQEHATASLEEAYERHLDGPFQFCRERLGSKVGRCYSTIYDLSAAKLAQAPFDWVVVGDVLVHLFSPLKALDVLAPLCRGTLVVTADRFRVTDRQPLMFFLGNVDADSRSWWMLNGACVRDLLLRVGFRKVTKVGRYKGIARLSGFSYDRIVFHASK